MNGPWTRRAVLQAGVAALGATVVQRPSWAGWGHLGDDPHALRLPEVVPANLPELACAASDVDLGDGRLRRAWTYNGGLPGPTWEARRGEWVTTTLRNGLGEPTITHWHGLVVDTANDGGPMLAIPPGDTYAYAFPIVQRASLNFYHPHPDMLTGKQVGLGLAGAFIVRDDEEDALGLPAGPYEVPVVLRDVAFDSAGNLAYNPTSSGFKGKTPLVNGMLNPRLLVDRGIYRLRILNGANARVFRLALSNRASFTIIGNDGGLLAHHATVSEVLLGMAERLDVLVDFRALGAGQTVALQCLDARWTLLQFTGTGANGMAYTVPSDLSLVQALSGPAQPDRTFSFDGMSRINGQVYDMHRLDFTVPFGVTERWRFRTGGNAPHPIHVHGVHFQVVSRTGGRGRVFPWEAGWKDTVLLNDRETVDVLVRFTTYRGRYLIHCHQLEHEGAGMMANFEVV